MKKLMLAGVLLALTGCHQAVGPPSVISPKPLPPGADLPYGEQHVNTPEEQAALEQTAQGTQSNTGPQ